MCSVQNATKTCIEKAEEICTTAFTEVNPNTRLDQPITNTGVAIFVIIIMGVCTGYA